MDPEIHMNIVELNMVREIKINGNNIDVLIALTVAGCPLADTIKKDVRNELMKFDQVKEVSVETTVMTKEELDEKDHKCVAAGRIMTRRKHGKTFMQN